MDEILEMTNTAATLLLLLYLLPAAKLAHHLKHRASMCFLIWAVVLQAIAPLISWIPDIGWPTVFFNVTLVLAVTLWRDVLWQVVRLEFSDERRVGT